MTTARSLNKVMIIGNLTRNPVIRTTGNGSIVCTFGIATNSTWRDSSGNLQERTEFHNIVVWNKLAEICAQILATGMLVHVEGELRTRAWDDANGVRHYRTEVKISDMLLLDDKGKKGVGVDEAKKAGGDDVESDKDEAKDDNDDVDDKSEDDVDSETDTKKDDTAKDKVEEKPKQQDNGDDLF
jgi:single-strand DNA-binding protein